MAIRSGRSAADVDGELPGGPYTSRVVSPMNVVPSFTAAPEPVDGLGPGVPTGRYDRSLHWMRSGQPSRLLATFRPMIPTRMKTTDPKAMHPIARQLTVG
jgi:hypothetical protein